MSDIKKLEFRINDHVEFEYDDDTGYGVIADTFQLYSGTYFYSIDTNDGIRHMAICDDITLIELNEINELVLL